MPKKRQSIDPEEQRYYNKYPSFPGLTRGFHLLRHSKGAYWEAVFGDFRTHAPELLDELIRAAQDESQADIRWMLLEIIGSTASPKALSLFATYLLDQDEKVRRWSAYGLRELNTREARKVLWEARSYTFIDAQETADFQQMLDTIINQR